MSAKSIQIAKEIDIARCNGNWSALPELGRRYKKYNPEGTILEQTIIAENNLVQVLNAVRVESAAYDTDNPSSITIETRVQPEQVRSIQNQLRAAIQLSDPNNLNQAQKEFAKIILARTHFECGQYQDALEIIEQLSFEKEQVSQGYGFILFLQARSIKAICLELTGQSPAAVQSYEGIEVLLSENSTVKYKSLIEWGEEALYRAILWGHNDEASFNVSSLLEIMRRYQMLVSVQPPQWRLQKRLKATRYSLSFISSVYREGQYTLPAGTADHSDTQQLEQQYFIVEQSQLHTIYEKMLYLEVPLPKAGQVNRPVLDFIDQFASDFELIGTTAYDLRGFVEVLDRASQRTFNSHSITRHLFLALVRLGEYDEAEHALESYLYLVGLITHGWKETRQSGVALATDKTGLNIPVPSIKRPVVFDNDIEQDDEPDSIADIKKSEEINVVHVLELLIVAIKMYCKDLGKGVDAVEMAEIAREFYQKQPKFSRDTSLKKLGASVYRAVGAAYGLLGCQTFDQDLRPSYHEKALLFLQHAVELNPDSWETYYQLALQQAEMHDVGQAFQSITKALQINASHLPSWHLFTLIVSCPGQGDFKQALKTCEVGLQQSDIGEMSDSQTNQSGYIGGNKTWGHEESEYHILFQMTRTLLLFALNGPESALESSSTLFTSYARIAIPDDPLGSSVEDPLSYGGAHNGMIISGSLGNLNELQTAAEIKHRRGRSGSHGTDISGSYLGSKSHENVAKDGSHTLIPGRARSASNLSSRVTPLSSANQTLAVPGQEEKHHHHHHLHGIHLFGSRSSSRLKSSDAQSLQLPQETQNSSQSLTASPYGELKTIGVASATSLHSIAPSITSTQSILQPSNVPSKPSVRTLQRKERSELILSNLWLLTADMFIKLGKLDEANKAIEEAEKANMTGNPHVWCVLGQLLLNQGDVDQAQASFAKGLSINPNDVRCHLWLAKTHMIQENFELAEGILDTLTKTNGWDNAEAWFFLGEIYRKTQRLDRTKACLFYALELESTTPIQPFSIVPRFV